MSSRGGYGRDGGRHRRGGGQFRGGGRHRGGGGRFRGPGRGEGGEEGSKPEGELDWSPPTSAEMLDHGIRSAITDYCNRQGPLLKLELEEEQRVVKERLLSWPLPRLQSEGLVLIKMSGRKHGAYFGKTVLIFTQASGEDLPFHRFSSGDLVTLCRNNPLTERAFEALVLDRGRWELRLVADGPPPGLNDGVWRVDKGVNMTLYLRAAAALRSLYKSPPLVGAPTPALEAPQQLPMLSSSVGYANEDGHSFSGGGGRSYAGDERGAGRGGQGRGGRGEPKRRRRNDEEEEDQLPLGTCIRDVLLGPSPASAAAAARPSGLIPAPGLEWASRQAGEGAPVAAGAGVAAVALSGTQAVQEDAALGMNRSQLAGVATALSHRVSLLQGPPGTGKTTTIVRYLVMLKRNFGIKVPILACAQSNVAVDNLLEGLVDAGLSAVRTGQPVKVRESLRDATLDARLINHPMQVDIELAANELREHCRRLPHMHGRDRGLGHRDKSIMTRRLHDLRKTMASQVLQDADVICATCVGAGGEQLADIPFPIVVLDEGSQCSEPEALIPLTKGASHVVLVGDHFQLPPVVQSQEAAAKGLDLSLFERFMQQGVPSALLQVQYRMHPALSAFPNARFYAGRLVDGVRPQQRLPPKGLRLPVQGVPMVMLDVHGQETSSQNGSKSNKQEAEAVARVVQAMMLAGETAADIGVVTPYLSQVQLVSNCLRQLAGSQPRTPMEEAMHVEVKSVDGYQGREKGIIVFSAVRANPEGQVGFLCDWRRMNVAITRAKRGLVVLGNTSTLERGDPHWAALVQHFRGSGCITPSVQTLC